MNKRQADFAGSVLIALCAVVLFSMFYGAYKIDAARGISISESLDSAGL